MPDAKAVLLIDDDPDLIAGMKLRFDAAGFSSIVAHSLRGGIDAARLHRPDAIVMDIRMRDGCGLDAVSELKDDQQTTGIPIIMLSGSVNSEQQALDRGARFFLRKPIRGIQVLNAVTSAIQETRQGKQNELTT